MSTAPVPNTLSSRQRHWFGILQVAFWAAYLYIPWHYGVFFGQRVQCLYFPRDWLLHGFAAFGYITLASIIVISRTQPSANRGGYIAFVAGVTAIVIVGLSALQYFQSCL